MLVLSVASMPVLASDDTISPKQDEQPIQRGYGQHDACFGDKYESDEDLKTGNEHKIEEILKFMIQPGT